MLRELKKKEGVLESVNTALLRTLNPETVAVAITQAGEAEMDAMWSFVGNKGNPRWLWHAIEHHTGKVLASVFGRRQDTVFLQLKALLEPFGITQYYTDYWGAYTRHLDPEEHTPGKRNTQKIERKHLTLRTRIKRLVRNTEFIPIKSLAATGSGGPGSYAGHSRVPSRDRGRPPSTGGSGL